MNITEDSIVRIEDLGKEASIVYVSGDLGGGTASIGYYATGVFTVLSSADALEVGEQYEIRHGMDMPLFIQLTGSTAPDLTLIVKGIS